MGAALAEAAAKRGDWVSGGVERTPAKALALEPLGIRAAETVPEAVAGAERVHVMLADDAAVDGCSLEAAGEALRSALVVDHSTTSPAGTAARAKRLELGAASRSCTRRSSYPQDVPRGRRDDAAAGARGRLCALRAGPARDDRPRRLPRRDVRTSRRPTSCSACAMTTAICGGLADVYAMAASLGIDAADAHALFGKFNPAGVLTYRGAAMAKGDYAPTFELTMARKDARLMIEVAHGRELAVLPAIAKRMDVLIERGFGADDMGVLSVDAVPPKR